jgi:hypothetical protein
METEGLTIDRLERWVLFGAVCRVVEISTDYAVVDLCTCMGELVERVGSDDVAVIGYLRKAQLDQAEEKLFAVLTPTGDRARSVPPGRRTSRKTRPRKRPMKGGDTGTFS